jgi:hypothetical protein
VDLGFHSPPPPPPGSVDELDGALRVGGAGGGSAGASGPAISLSGAPSSVTTARIFRGDLDLLSTEYSHATPFSGQGGDPECSWGVATSFTDTGALGDGRDWYYLAVALDTGSGTMGGFGEDSLGVLRPRPEDSPADLVASACP